MIQIRNNSHILNTMKYFVFNSEFKLNYKIIFASNPSMYANNDTNFY